MNKLPGLLRWRGLESWLMVQVDVSRRDIAKEVRDFVLELVQVMFLFSFRTSSSKKEKKM